MGPVKTEAAMTRRRLLLTLGAGGALALLAGLPLVVPTKSALEVKYGLVQPGMSEGEVAALLGQPFSALRFRVRPTHHFLTYYGDPLGNSDYVMIEYDDSGRVVDKEFGQGQARGWLQKTRNRLGW
jgi:hypothetical protein